MLRRTFLALPCLAIAAEQRRSLKITGLETKLTVRPPGQPFYDALQTLGVHTGTVTLRLLTDGGITGYASSYFGAVEGGPKVLQAILEEEVKPLIVGQDPAFPKAFPWFGEPRFWERHIAELREQLEAVEDPPLLRTFG